MSSCVSVFTSPARYVQGQGAIGVLGAHLKGLGTSPLVVADDTVWGIVEAPLTAGLAAAGLTPTRVGMGRYATPEAVDTIVDAIQQGGHDVVVGVGGGTTIDAAKAAGYLAGVRWASVPTAASTDAPTSALSVIDSDEGEFIEYRFFPQNPDLVLIDTQLVAEAPVELIISGIGDALATWLEARATRHGTGTAMTGGRPTHAATALAKLSWDLLHEHALAAVDAVRGRVVTRSLEAVVEANTLLSGLGFESGGLAAAHAVHNGLSGVPQTRGLTHGAKVNIGSIAQLVIECAPVAELEDFIAFTTRIGLPTTLTEVGLSTDDRATLHRIAETATAERETIHNMPMPVSADAVVAALIAADGIARRVRAERGLPEPVPYVAAG